MYLHNIAEMKQTVFWEARAIIDINCGDLEKLKTEFGEKETAISPYLPDLAPTDYFSFPNLKK